MKYLKYFKTESEYSDYMGGIPFLPNVSYIVEKAVYFNPAPEKTITLLQLLCLLQIKQ